jgi:hypothetical protein
MITSLQSAQWQQKTHKAIKRHGAAAAAPLCGGLPHDHAPAECTMAAEHEAIKRLEAAAVAALCGSAPHDHVLAGNVQAVNTHAHAAL